MTVTPRIPDYAPHDDVSAALLNGTHDDQPGSIIDRVLCFIAGCVLATLVWWVVAPAIVSLAEASVPPECRNAGAEIVACVEERQ